jgi:rhamnose transport system substrate-binding protein
MNKKMLAALAGLVVAAVVTVGLTAGVGNARPSKSAAGYKVYLIPKFIGIPVFTQNSIGAKLAAKELGDTVTYNGPTTASATGQVQFINTAIQQGYNAIIISADDPNAVAPALKRAAAKGIKVISYDGDAAPDARYIYVSPPDAASIGAAQVEWIGSSIGYKGDIAILSAAPTAANQNTWIKYMKATLRLPKYKNMKLVTTVYGNDDDTKSAQQMQSLLQAYPNLKGVISPTTVGVAAAARVLTQQKACGKVQLTGLGLPSQMKPYVKSGCVKKVGLWSETDFGYLAEYVAHNVLAGKLTNATGKSLRAGHLGIRTVTTGHTIILSKPLVFTKSNIDNYHF